MRNNPPADWAIAGVAAVCRKLGISCEPMRGGGSHYKIAHPRLARKLTVSFKRPIKPANIKQLVALADEAENLT